MRDPIAEYDRTAATYPVHRKADPRIEARVHAALGDARTVLNVGAGTGSYEPLDRHVVAVEPSKTMRSKRPAHLSPALIGTAANLPFDDKAFDAAMAMITVHHWPDLQVGLAEMRRVTRGPVVIMAFDPSAETEFWLSDYLPEMQVVSGQRDPSMRRIADGLGGDCRVEPIKVALDCSDGFQGAWYGRPEALLDPEVRKSQSSWAFLPGGAEARAMAALKADLESGAWDRKYGHLRTQPEIKSQLRLIISQGEPR